MSSALVDHCRELLTPVGTVRVRRMFGGHGLYVDDLFIALIAYDRLYLKADATTRTAFESAGSEAFVYEGQGRTVTVGSYWSAPADAMDAPEAMRPWAKLAIEAALRARQVRPPGRRGGAAVKPAARPASRSAPKTRSRPG